MGVGLGWRSPDGLCALTCRGLWSAKTPPTGVPRHNMTFVYSGRGFDVTHHLMAGHCKTLTESPDSRDAPQPITLAKPASSMAT
jgi:hypothetical protein